MLRSNKGQLAIIGLVIVLAIIVTAGYFVSQSYTTATRPGQKTPMDAAKGVECQSNLSQIRSAINMYRSSNERFPQGIGELGVSSISACPVSNQPYTYDPNSGRVWCTTPGHERY
ncbi:MAG: type II secretion system protein [Armatimonadota bacterium]